MLLGRAVELARLDELLTELRAGRGGALALLGEAGIGKSALLDELVARAADMTVLRSSATDLDQPLAYRTLADLLAPLWREIRERDEGEAQVLAAALGLEAQAARPSETAIGMALLDALSRASDARPVLIVLDDVEWTDESSRLALAFVTRRVAVERIGVVIASRQPVEHVSWMGRIAPLDVEPLSADDAPALAAAASAPSRPPLAPAVVALCWDATGGNTLAFAQLVRSLDDDERSGRRPPNVDHALVGDLGAEFAKRVEQLPGATRLALAATALAGPAPLAIVERALAALGLTAADLEPAKAADVFATVNGASVFSHALLRTAAVATGSTTDLRRVHVALAGAFEGVDDERRAWHLSDSAEWTDEDVAATLVALAETYTARGALAESARAWRRAAELSPDPLVAAERFGRALLDWWANGQALAALEESMSPAFRVNEPSFALPRAVIAGQALAWQGKTREGIDVLRRAADDAAEQIPAQAAIALSVAASFMAFTHGLEAAAELSQEAVRRAGDAGDAIAGLATAAVCGWHELLLGQTEAALARLGPLEMMIESLVPVGGDAAHLVLLTAMKRMVTERFAEAQSLLDNLISTSGRRGWAAWSDFARRVLAAVHLRRGDLTDAWAITSQNPEDSIQGGAPLGRAWGLGLAAQVAAALGGVEETERAVVDAKACAAQLDLPPLDAWADAALGHLELSRGNDEVAAEVLQRADDVFRSYQVNEPGLVWWHGDLLDALTRCGRTAEAQTVLDRLDELTATTERAWARAVVFRARAALAEPDQAEALYEAALSWHDRLEAPLERARTLLSRGQSRIARGDDASGRGDVAEALTAFRASGAQLWVVRAEQLLGQPAAPREPSLLSSLTPAELRVALAVGSGLSNREVAQQLFVSVKTVDYHLHSIYLKRNLRSRTELALALAAERAVLHTQ